MSGKNLVWLDCDPGHDDAFAIILAGYSQQLDLIGISSVAGNQTIDKTTENALKIMRASGLINDDTPGCEDASKLDYSRPLRLEDSLSHGGMSCPLLRGCSRPLFREPFVTDIIFGDTGLNTHSAIEFPQIPPAARKYFTNINSQPSCHFTTLMFEYFKSFFPRKVTLVAVGPLTNVALLLLNHPSVRDFIDRIVIMGGALGLGNVTPAAEFNVFCDPEAASLVFNSNVNIFMVPLEVTHTTLATEAVLNKIGELSSNFSAIMIELLLYFKTSCKEIRNMDSPPLHDPCAVAFVIDPSLFE
jgi:inosine-uridine nucleoside N-ribohydrolase